MFNLTALRSDLTAARKGLVVCQRANPHLSAAGRLANAGRIRNFRERVESLETLISVIESDDGAWNDFGQFEAAL